MADKCKLADNGNTFEFSPLIRDYDVREDRRRTIDVALDGSLYTYEWGSKSEYSVPINNVAKADADQINTWWQNLTTLTFTPDLSLPAQTVSVKILNEKRPMQHMAGTGVWKTKYEGTLILRQP